MKNLNVVIACKSFLQYFHQTGINFKGNNLTGCFCDLLRHYPGAGANFNDDIVWLNIKERDYFSGKITDEEFYEVWHGGQGMLLIIDEKDANYCIKRAKDFEIQAKIVGKITKKENSPRVSINSKLTPNKKIIYT